MSNRSALPLFYLILSFLLVFAGMAYGTSQLIVFFKEGADLKNILLLDTESLNDYYQPTIVWNVDENEGRKMEKATLNKISKDYVASFYHEYQALKTGQTKGLHDYYTEKARTQMLKLVNSQKEDDPILSGTTISHHATLNFYSEDGTLAILTDNVISYSTFKINGYAYSKYDTSVFKSMLLLEDNFWRIRHKVKEETIHHEKKQNRIHPDSLFWANGDDFIIKGINYYPKDHPWIEMWESFDSINFQSDFKKITKAGFNTIRIFIPYECFGTTRVRMEELEKLAILLDHAHRKGLNVIITLFDFFLNYAVEEWTLSDRHAEQVVNYVRNHPALLAWDVKNEPDLDFENIGKEDVKEWLSFIIRRIRSYDNKTPITIGWSQPEAAKFLSEEVDFYSFHFYRDPKSLPTILDSLNLEKPTFLGETGSHSFSKWWFPFKRDEEKQLEYLSLISQVIEQNKLHYAFWTLYDFDRIPSNVAGKWPWQKGPQGTYGIIRSDESTKPGYDYIVNFNHKKNEKRP